MFDEKSIEEVKEMVDKRINELEGMVANQSEMIKKQEKNFSDAIAYVAKAFGISEKEALELIHSMKS